MNQESTVLFRYYDVREVDRKSSWYYFAHAKYLYSYGNRWLIGKEIQQPLSS